MSDYISGLRPSDLRKGDVILISHAGQLFDVEREAPVPPLPTAPYTVIRVTWNKGQHSTDDIRTLANGYWRGLSGFSTANDLADAIIGFDILSEPPALTAKAVLEDVRRQLLVEGENPEHVMFNLAGIGLNHGVTDE